jgi:hypothetical protein
VYARNHCLMPRNSSTRLKSDRYGPGVQRVTIGREARMVNSEAGQGVRWGGHGEGLRRSRGDAAGVEVGTSLLDRFGRERGNHPRSPQPASSQLTGGQARCRLRSVGWGGGLVVCAGRRRELAGESPVGPAPSGVRSQRRG